MKQKLLKTVLVALALVTGSMGMRAATGDVVTNADIDFSNAIDNNVVTGTVNSMSIGQHSTYITEINPEGRLVLGNGTHIVSIPEGQLAGNKDVVTISFDLAFGKLSGKNVGFSLLDSESGEIGSFTFIPYSGSLTNNTFDVELNDLYYGYNTVLWDRKVSFVITLDYANSSITTYTKCYKSGTGKAATENTHVVTMTNSKPLSVFQLTSNYSNNDRRCQFDNLKITTTEGDYTAATANYTINYLDESSNKIKDSRIANADVDSKAALLEQDKDPISFEGVKYLYKSDNASDVTVTSDNSAIVNVIFRKAYTATLNVTTNINGESNSIKTDLVEADDNSCNWGYTYSLYALKDGVYYKADNTASFGETGEFSDGETINKEVTYSTAEPDIVFFAENPVASSSDVNYSNGSNGYVAAQNYRDRGIAVGTLPVGQYSFEVNIVAANRRAVCLRESRNDPIASVGTSNEDMNIGLKNATFTLNSATSNLYINGANSGETKTNQSETFDYVIVRKTADLATVTSVGFATYSPSSNVAVPENVKVYTVTVDAGGNSVTLHPVDAGSVVEAGTGYVIEAAEGSYPFAVSNEAVNDIGNNALKVSDVTVTVGEFDNIYVLAKRNDGNVGFLKVASGVEIPAGKAYLELSESQAKASFLSFGNIVTAIESTESTAKAGNGVYYSLQGIRTSAPAKGLYIINGKKVVVK